MKIFKIALITLLTFFTASCGFHLRGQNYFPKELHAIYLESNSPYSPLIKQLKQILIAHKIRVVNHPYEAPITLKILSDTFSEQVTSTSSTTQLSTYSLYYSVIYQVNDRRGKSILPPKTVMTTRTYTINTNQVLNGTNQQRQLQQDLLREAVYQLLNRLSAKEIRYVLNAQ